MTVPLSQLALPSFARQPRPPWPGPATSEVVGDTARRGAQRQAALAERGGTYFCSSPERRAGSFTSRSGS